MRRTLNSKKRRQLAKRQFMFLVGGFGCVIAAILLVFSLTPEASRDRTAGAQGVQARQESSGSGQERLSIGFGGDACFGLKVADVLKEEGSDYPWSGVTALIRDYDLCMVNLEGPVCATSRPAANRPFPPLKADPACLSGMANAGISAVGLANDRVMDYGLPGLQETLSLLQDHHLQAVGAGANLRLAEQPLVMEAQDGTQVAVVAMCDISGDAAGENSAGVCPTDKEAMSTAIKQARKLAPYVVAFMHWGTVGSGSVTDRQRELAHACVEAGANVVIGCHPHVIQGIEMWQGVPIIYSLGNMIFFPEEDSGKTALFAGCRFSSGSLTSLEIVPLSINGGRAEVLSGDAGQEVLESLKEASPGVDLEVDPKSQVGYLNL
jgi:poly-gamma-glutamate synthesis protein (capsule biosynthesis protein)